MVRGRPIALRPRRVTPCQTEQFDGFDVGGIVDVEGADAHEASRLAARSKIVKFAQKHSCGGRQVRQLRPDLEPLSRSRGRAAVRVHAAGGTPGSTERVRSRSRGNRRCSGRRRAADPRSGSWEPGGRGRVPRCEDTLSFDAGDLAAWRATSRWPKHSFQPLCPIQPSSSDLRVGGGGRPPQQPPVHPVTASRRGRPRGSWPARARRQRQAAAFRRVRRRCGRAAASRLIDLELRHPLSLVPPPRGDGRAPRRGLGHRSPPSPCEPTAGSPLTRFEVRLVLPSILSAPFLRTSRGAGPAPTLG